MSIKILTKTGEEITAVDDARAYNFDAGNRSGIVKGALNEGRFFSASNNVIALDSCELRIAGHRVVIDSAESITLTNAPANNTRYSMIAEIVVNDSSTPSFRLFIQPSTIALIKDNLYKTTKGNGTYQLEIGRFTLTPAGLIEDVVRTADVISGGTTGGDNTYIEIGNVTTNTISQGSQANVDVENVVDEQTGKTKTNFTFDIPATTGTTISVDGVEQESLSFEADPQTQLNQMSNSNLLINGDFRVNQRGKSSYTGGEHKYSVDRWIQKVVRTTVETKSGTTENNSGGLKFTETTAGADNWLLQSIENFENLLGKTVTLSCKISNLSITSGKYVEFGLYNATTSYHAVDDNNNYTLIQSIRISEAGIYNLTINIPETLSMIRLNTAFLLPTNDLGATITIDWVKLELGSVATAFSPRPYAEELALCQRYYRRYNSTSVSTKLLGLCLSNGSVGFLPLMLDIPFRTAPTITYNGASIYNGVAGGNINISSIAVGLVSEPATNLTLQINFTGEATKVYCLRLGQGPSNYIDLDAEIY